MTNQIIIQNAKIYTEDKLIEEGSIVLQDGKITEITEDNTELDTSFAELIDGTGYSVIPGFIDTHIHGANGADLMDATEKASDTIANILPQEGTKSFLATTMTQSKENIEKALSNVAKYKNKDSNAEVLGIHLEGPFININKKGAQPGEYVIPPNIDLFKQWQETSGHLIKTITVAPECDPTEGTFTEQLNEMGVNVSAGHTSLNFAQVERAVKQGVQQLTHLCNAMEGIHHRDIGAVGAAFVIDSLFAELIADNIHVSPQMMQLIYNNIGSERLIMITDAMRAKWLEPGEYDLGGQAVNVTEDRATLVEGGSLAGSILKMNDAAKNMLALDGVTLQDIIQMASVNPAKQINVYDRKGSITVGKDANLVLIDEDINVKYTICNGVIAYKEEKE